LLGTTAKASQLFNFLRHNLSNCSPSVKASSYLTIIRPVLEYAVSVWDPYQQNDILSLEKIQCRAARWVLSNYDRLSSVTEMLEILDWPSLTWNLDVELVHYKYFIKGWIICQAYQFHLTSCLLSNPPDPPFYSTQYLD